MLIAVAVSLDVCDVVTPGIVFRIVEISVAWNCSSIVARSTALDPDRASTQLCSVFVEVTTMPSS